MEFCSAYEKYSNCLVEIIDQLRSESLSQEKVAQSERNAVSTIENQYMAISDELQQAHRAVREQYQSVWESCTRNAGIRRPQDQRPAATDLPWKQAASSIRNWFSMQTQQAFIERQKKVREEAAKKAAMAAAQAENEKRKAEEAARAEKERAEALVESLKRKYRGY